MPTDDSERRDMSADELRPDLSAEAFTPRMRSGLFGLTLLEEALTLAVFIGLVVWPYGLLDVSPFWGFFLMAMWVCLGFFLMVIFGGLAGNNARLSSTERNGWLASFLFASPIAIPAYFLMHVRPAPYRGWIKPHNV